jgi:uncharacterized protein YndB with AHSA1/START domain
MEHGHVAQVTTSVKAPVRKVWRALVDPAQIERYMFGAKVTSDWQEGSSITWKGEFQGRPYEDTGEVIRAREPNELSYRHLSGGDAAQAHIVDIRLKEEGDRTEVTLTQDNNPDEQARTESEKNWTAMLDGMKKLVETS